MNWKIKLKTLIIPHFLSLMSSKNEKNNEEMIIIGQITSKIL